MRATYFAALAAAAVALAPPDADAQSDVKREELIVKVQPSVVRVVVAYHDPAPLHYDPACRDANVLSIGSGFVVALRRNKLRQDLEGYEADVVTNRHVAYGCDGPRRRQTAYIQVFDYQGTYKAYKATRLGHGGDVDIAALRAPGPLVSLTELTWQRISPLRWAKGAKPGQEVLAFGFPSSEIQGGPHTLEGGFSITRGIVSSINRTFVIRRGGNVIYFAGLVQTDAEINSGNSGGPLIDSEGAVVGVNTFKVPDKPGLGLAISARIAELVSRQLFESSGGRAEAGTVRRADFGVAFLDLDATMAALLVPLTEQSVWIEHPPIKIVERVTRRDALAGFQAQGLNTCDVVTAIDRQPVRTLGDYEVARLVHGTASRVRVRAVQLPHALCRQLLRLANSTAEPPGAATDMARNFDLKLD